MAKIAKVLGNEYGLSETVFIPNTTPHEINEVPIRIYTPNGEIPYGGHPSLGTAVAILERDGTVILKELAGDVKVEVQLVDRTERSFRATLTAPILPEFRPVDINSETVRRALGISSEMSVNTIGVWNAGVPFLFVKLARTELLSTISPDLKLIEKLTTQAEAKGLYVFVEVSNQPDAWVRMFAPLLGISEDPATGAAATAFAGYVASRSERDISIKIDQGYEIGRPSSIEVKGTRAENGKLRSVEISGLVSFGNKIEMNV